MGVSSSQLQPQELLTFKGLSTDLPLADIEIPEKPENRRQTNALWLKILGVVIIAFLPFVIYTLYYSDIDRVTKGYDKCGNVCGKENYRWNNIPCSGKNWLLYPHLQYEDSILGKHDFQPITENRQCVQSCKEGYTSIMGRCLKITDDNELDTYSENDVKKVKYHFDMGAYLDDVKGQIIISCLFSILVTMGMLFLFKHSLGFVVWGILIGCYFGLIIIVAILWCCYLTAPEDVYRKGPKSLFLEFSVIFTICAIIAGLVMFWCRKKIKLVIMLLKEATKAVFDMPGLIALPVICVIAIVILTFIFGIMFFSMFSAGTLQLLEYDFYYYASDPIMIFTMIYCFVIYLWLTQFFTGIQYMVIAGTVSKWYFCRDKIFLRSPILNSAVTAFRYHLGTVALGGLIITFVQVIKGIIMGILNNDKLRGVVEHIADAVETFFKFLSKNAYIITAIHGEAFIRSGKRAAKLIVQNIKDIVAINYVGDFVLGMAQILIVVITILISMAIFAIAPGNVGDNNILAYFIIGIVSFLVSSVAFGVFQTTIDTLFICYCEDSLLNDGMARPYFMSRNLMEFVQDSKGVYGKK